MRQVWLATAAVMILIAAASPSRAQRAAENAVNAAEDAFGTSIGNETIGLYSATSARGFDPGAAGNIRMEGLYFDQQGVLQGQLYAGTTVRVGLSAQSYPFLAPTGIVDTRLRRPKDQWAGGASFTLGPYDGKEVEVELSAPIVPGKLGTFITLTGTDSKLDTRGVWHQFTYAGMASWTPSDKIEVVAFLQGHEAFINVQPFIFTAGGIIPPQYDRSVYFGQPWARRDRLSDHFGTIGSVRLADDWLLRAGIFRSVYDTPEDYVTFFRNVDANGHASSLDLLKASPNRDVSTSGEVRLTHTIVDGPLLHTFHLAVRGRDAHHFFGGGASASLGPADIGVYDPRPEPTYVVPTPNLDQVSQVTPGVSYVGRWLKVGEFSVGLQKSFYRREVTVPGLAPTRTESNPWLYNGTLGVYLSDAATIYGSYTRGLEASGIAPDTASNRGEAMPASLTRQIDAGIRYKLTQRLSLVAGVFEVKKPYFERDATNLFTDVGSLSHRGVEMSLSGQVAPGLSIVAGAMLLRARIDAIPSVASFIAPVPVGRPNRNVRLNVQYGPASWRGFSIDGQVSQDGPAYTNRLNTIQLGANTTFDLGARYNFKVFDKTSSLRARLLNVTDAYGWTVAQSGAYAPTGARRYTLQLITDF